MESRTMNKMDISQEEVSKLTKAMKDDKFRGYMDEYCKETSDPKNRKEYLQYLDQLEAKGEMPDGQALLRTTPGCCVKTRISFKSGQMQKCFINIVHSDQLDDLRMDKDSKGEGHKVHLPYSLSPPRPDRDRGDEYCMTCDFAVSSWTYYQALQDPRVLKMLVDTAADGLGAKFLQGFEEVKKDYKVMRRMQCKGGAPMPMSVRRELLKDTGKSLPKSTVPPKEAVTPSELRQMRADAKAVKAKEKAEEDAKILQREAEAERGSRRPKQDKLSDTAAAPRIRVPTHHLVHSGTYELTDMLETDHMPKAPISTVPRLLRLVVELPTVKKVSDVNLEVTSLNVVVEVDDKYYLDLPLPYEIDDANGTAKFDKIKQTLTLEMPVIPRAPDPNVCRPAAVSQPEGKTSDDDLALSEGRGSSGDDEPPPLESEEAVEQELAAVADGVDEEVATHAEPCRGGTLELGGEGTSLHIPAAAAAAAVATSVAEVSTAQDSDDPNDGCEEGLPEFVASDHFDGARPGYAFKTGDSGLGYYRDLRQALPRSSAASRKSRQVRFRKDENLSSESAAASTAHCEPLVTEVVSTSSKIGSTTRAPLPAAVQRYVEETSALRKRVDEADCKKGTEDIPATQPVLWHQTRQNITLLLDVGADMEVADVQLILADRLIIVSFCTRPAYCGGDGLWQRHRLRRVLCGLVDHRQWHAELTSAEPDGPSGGNARRRLIFLIRKVEAELWSEAFDTSAYGQLYDEDLPGSSAFAAAGGGAVGRADDQTDAAAPSDTDTTPSADPSLHVAKDGPDLARCASGNETASAPRVVASGLVDAGIGEDSAALDAVTPVALRSSTGDDQVATEDGTTGETSTTAASTMAQSAAAMGHSVLLRTRLMYQLL
eukprot:TRINITY_DN9307_c0_g1_i1.p1 TRINITY_DN9307_c0_g1~~TRINITY_DN9307_c0_g1_i1.p1  ORF type:complete len:883 (+),score=183.73 TRINITY_DN9307_c0_g1_i1:77-2725(+)